MAALGRLLGALRQRAQWLLIFDNAESSAGLRQLIPAGHGHVIITSRNPDWRNVASGLEVAEFARAESLSLLKARLPGLDNDAADRVAEALGDLPLAVDQAASLLADTEIGVDVYLKQLSQRLEKVLSWRNSGTSVPVAASWTISFDQLAADHPAALQLLTLVAWLAPEPVPLTVVTGQGQLLPAPLAEVADDQLSVGELVGILRRRGMATITSKVIQLHRVPAGLLRARTGKARFAKLGCNWPGLSVRILHAVAPDNAWNNPSAWPIWQSLLSHVLVACDPSRDLSDVVDDLCWLLRDAGDYIQSRGEPAAALPLFERAYKLSKGRLGADDPVMLDTATDFAVALADLGDHEYSRELNEDILRRRRHIQGYEHSKTLNTANHLANDLSQLGDHEQACRLAQDTLARRRRAQGEDHADTLLAATLLAVHIAKRGNHEQARRINDEAFLRCRAALGVDHPHTLATAHNLAVNCGLSTTTTQPAS